MEKLIVFSDGQKHEMNALIDSGNLLTEPISALPVIVCTDLTLIHFLHSTSLTLPYCGAGGTGLYKLYKPDAIYICKNSALERVGDAYIAFDTKIVKKSDFDLIVPLTLFH